MIFIVGLSKPRTTMTMLFIGDSATDVSRLVSALLTKRRKVMYVDISLTQRFFFRIFGNAIESEINYRGICYTKDRIYATEHWLEYDVVIMCSDDGSTLQDLHIPIDNIYMVSGISRGSIALLENIMNIAIIANSTYSLVIRASKQQVDYFRAYRALDMIISRHMPEQIFYVPITDKDLENELLLDYGSVDMRQVSSNMQNLLWNVKAGFMV